MHDPATSPESAAGRTGTLEVCSLGVVDFDSAWSLQERLVYDLGGRDDQTGHLLLCEHPPLITMGREASRKDLNIPESELERRLIALRWVGRGGGAFTHVPGQLAVYALLPLSRMGIGIPEFRQRLESAVSNVCREFRVPVKRDPDLPGLWSRGGQIATFGAALRSGVTCFGLWFNVHPWPGFLNLACPSRCGERQTSLQAMTRRRLEMGSVREAVARQIASGFQYQVLNYSTGHPLLVRTRQRVCIHA